MVLCTGIVDRTAAEIFKCWQFQHSFFNGFIVFCKYLMYDLNMNVSYVVNLIHASHYSSLHCLGPNWYTQRNSITVRTLFKHIPMFGGRNLAMCLASMDQRKLV